MFNTSRLQTVSDTHLGTVNTAFNKMAETTQEKIRRMRTWCDCGDKLQNGKCRKCERAEEILEEAAD